MRGIAYRRHHRRRMEQRAKRVLAHLFGDEEHVEVRYKLWADNLRKCSCHLCRSDPGPSIQELRAPEVPNE